MKGRTTRQIAYLLACVLVLALTACSLPIGMPVTGEATATPAQAASPVVVTATLEPQPDATPTAAPTNLPEPTATTIPTAVSVPTIAVTQPAQVSNPYVVTLRTAQVRHGPGMSYDPAHMLGAGTTAPVQGRSADGQWWVIPGPGSGPGPVGWIQAADVQFFGSASQVPVIQSPSNPADVPIHFDPGSPPANACVVEPSGSGLGPVLVHLGPGEHFNISHRLGGWAEAVKTEMGWYQILLGPGEVGWVNGQRVQASGPCP